MTKLIKKVQLGSEPKTSRHADSAKGTQTNPYTQEEMTQLLAQEAWQGGYVEGTGYIAPVLTSGIFSSSITLSDLLELVSGLTNFSSFERKCLKHYLQGTGNGLVLSQEEWAIVLNAVPENIEYKKGTEFTYNNQTDYKCLVSFYNNSDLDWALGSATVTFTENGSPVGISDTYDFNALSEGNRSNMAEKLTRIMGYMEQLGVGKAYAITYGIN